MLRQHEVCDRISECLRTQPIHDPVGYEALAHLKLPGPNYLATLAALHRALEPKLYVEIGVRNGDSLKLASPRTKCIAIDKSDVRSCVEPRPNLTLAVSTSDDFFAHKPNSDRCRGFDLAFIDGDHSFEQAARDFENLEVLAKPSSVIAIHDVIPLDGRTATKVPQTSFWTGDVWKLMRTILVCRPDWVAFTVACPPTGLGIVGRLSAEHGLIPKGWDRSGANEIPFPETWEDQAMRLNIIPNNGAAIAEAFSVRKAA